MSRYQTQLTVASKQTGKINIVVVDDHPLIRSSLMNILNQQSDFAVIGEAEDGEQAIAVVDEIKPDIVIMDISLPKLNGLEATRVIKKKHPGVAVLALTVHSDDEHVLSILEAGADGYLTKSVFSDEIVQAIRGVFAGEVVLSKSIAGVLLEQANRYPRRSVALDSVERLTPRELAIIKLVALGLSNKEIAEEQQLNIRTVKGYLSTIFAKLGVTSRTEAVTYGIRNGFITVEDVK
jgi:DNA-binding NarL/FixJ family response regulator